MEGNQGRYLSYFLCLNYFFRIQIATVHGAVRECGDVDFPGIFIRLDDPSILEFIKLRMSHFCVNKFYTVVDEDGNIATVG